MAASFYEIGEIKKAMKSPENMLLSRVMKIRISSAISKP
jgi:hypothetical protein